ncbi:MAG: S1/P1 nuclease, partial [Rhodanobacteraceae bacterium]
LALSALMLSAPPAFAWGSLGHRIVAQLAQKQLNPAVQPEIDRLLALQGARKLADVATWADDLRDTEPSLFQQTAKLHYINFHSGDCIYDPPRDCRDGQCVVAAIQHYAAILGNRSLPDAQRAQALDFVAHFVGDAHQPLHASYRDDKGGNDYQVRWHGHGTNLHRIWDTTMLNARGLSYQAYANEIAAQTVTSKPVVAGTPAQWAEQSCRIVRDDGVYPPTRTIDNAYVQRERPIAEARLRAAGAQLADLLNRELGDSSH